jgi:uncharacterized membrane protein (DUF106 family)
MTILSGGVRRKQAGRQAGCRMQEDFRKEDIKLLLIYSHTITIIHFFPWLSEMATKHSSESYLVRASIIF